MSTPMPGADGAPAAGAAQHPPRVWSPARRGWRARSRPQSTLSARAPAAPLGASFTFAGIGGTSFIACNAPLLHVPIERQRRPDYSAALSNTGVPARNCSSKRRLVRLGGDEMLLLDVAEAADFFRDRGKTDRDMMIVRRELRQHFVEHRFIVRDQLAFGAPLLRMAERIERRAAQELQFRQQPERRQRSRDRSSSCAAGR